MVLRIACRNKKFTKKLHKILIFFFCDLHLQRLRRLGRKWLGDPLTEYIWKENNCLVSLKKFLVFLFVFPSFFFNISIFLSFFFLSFIFFISKSYFCVKHNDKSVKILLCTFQRDYSLLQKGFLVILSSFVLKHTSKPFWKI